MAQKVKNQPETRSKKIFPGVCDHLRTLNPYTNRNFNDVYVEYLREKMKNPSFDTTRLSRWIQGSKSDLLKKPVYINYMIQFIKDTFENQKIDPEPIATQIRAKFQNNGDVFYDFVKGHEKLYLNKEYIQYLANLIRDENTECNKAINQPLQEPWLSYLFKRKEILVYFGIAQILIIALTIYLTLEISVKHTLQTQSVVHQKEEEVISPPKKVYLFKQLPKNGQLIIPKGIYFQITTNMRGNAREFKREDSMEYVIKLTWKVAKDRANFLDKNIKEFPTVIWENSDERYQKDILTLQEYPNNNTIENITKPLILYSKEHIIMFEYCID